MYVSGGITDSRSAMLDSTVLDEVDEAIAELRAGRPVVVIDDEDRENEGDLVMAAEVADRLLLPPMVANTEDPAETAFTVSVDARDGIESGISAADRAHTLRLLADPGTRPDQLCREVCNEDGSVARAPQLRSFADAHGLKFVSIEQLSSHVRAAAPAI